jgi:hypothetical protein
MVLYTLFGVPEMMDTPPIIDNIIQAAHIQKK